MILFIFVYFELGVEAFVMSQMLTEGGKSVALQGFTLPEQMRKDVLGTGLFDGSEQKSSELGNRKSDFCYLTEIPTTGLLHGVGKSVLQNFQRIWQVLKKA